ncbi:uncharacterized protein (DUF2235 family) [Streptomyces sp. SAI-126]|jgi:uncharacterized protein (DUF2235 family)|uniref:DUF2235 domain-containing protein n=1 Tax=unclassified Streptomyces TaxID=2593676 RepID=UPI000F4E5E5F|nr:DUF2235 domain-containing protein [Streptomyces sp. TUS-ST3]GLP71466.1 hypothetical protein TUSST3_80860 [Streptomyces sp. TUS-ST3]
MAKRLVVCCDGTWNLADQPSKTNVAKVALAVRRRSAAGTEQRVYYHSGVGTNRRERLRGGAFGVGLSRNVLDAYRFLVHTFEPGDSLYLFGFSRGAFTARSLAGLVRNCGILRPEQVDRIGEAWALYRSRADKPTSVAATLFRRAYSYETEIRFVGVWDTVGSLGIPVPAPWFLQPLVDRFNHRWAFHDTTLSKSVNGAFQALAVDEERSAFPPTLWQQEEGADRDQELLQVWFSGVHLSVGGGEKDSGLSDITLLWMVRQAIRYGLEFDPQVLSAQGPDVMDPDKCVDFAVQPNPLGPWVPSRKGFYRVFKPLHRPIGQERDKEGRLVGHEYLADTVLRRRAGDPRYRPPALETYLEDVGERFVRTVPLAFTEEPVGTP